MVGVSPPITYMDVTSSNFSLLSRFTKISGFCLPLPIARLNDTWTNPVRSLARDPKITVQSEVFESSRSLLLQSMLYFLQVIGRRVST